MRGLRKHTGDKGNTRWRLDWSNEYPTSLGDEAVSASGRERPMSEALWLNHEVMFRHRKWQSTRFRGMQYSERLEQVMSSWPGVSTCPHRFGGREFRFNAAEIGHIHTDGAVDLPFPRAVRDTLLAEGLALEHRWVPNSGWVTFQVRGEEDFKHATWLMRLSYLRYVLKTASNPRGSLDEYGDELQLSPQLKSLLELFVPRSTGG